MTIDVAEQTITATAEPATAISSATIIACDIATGAATDATAVAIGARGAWRNLNAKGNGSESYRRARSPGQSWRFVSSERLPRGTFLASDRKCAVRGDVFVGDLIADYARSISQGKSTAISQGKSTGEAKHDGQIGLVTGPGDGAGFDVEWLDVAHQKDGTWRVILPTGAHLTFPAASWR